MVTPHHEPNEARMARRGGGGGGGGGEGGGRDRAERWSNMEGDEWSYMPARGTDARRQISEHEISSGKHGGTDREVEIK